MATKFILEQRVLNPHVQMEIDEHRYNALANARSVLADALSFEQGYELMLGNFIEMEMAFTEIGLRATLEKDYGHTTMAGLLREANRQVINVLTAMRSYVDQMPQLFKALDLNPKFGTFVKSKLNDMHSASLHYQFVCELRNHAQHQGTAIHGLEASLVPRSDSNGWAEAVSLLAYKSELMASNFKARVLAKQPDKIDVRSCVRMSMFALGSVHLNLRAHLAPKVDEARTTFNVAISDYQSAGADSFVGLAARCIDGKNDDIPVFLDWDDVRQSLALKNNQPPRLWARLSPGEPTVDEILSLRSAVGDTTAQAARRVFVSEARWSEWEAGMPMSQGLFILYQLQSGKHPSHEIRHSASVSTETQATGRHELT